MLYDKRWDAKPQQDWVDRGVSLRGLIAWLETKPPNETYLFIAPDKCVMAQYLESIGYRGRARVINFGNGHDCWLLRIAHESGHFRHTFGEALDRAKAELRELESHSP